MAELQEPKKAMTAFFIYLNANREKLVKDMPPDRKSGGAGASKFASEQWKVMSAAGKKPYEDKAAANKSVYDKALEAFKAAGGQVGKRKAEKKEKKGKESKKAKRAKGGPKRPTGGGFGQYLNEVRKSVMEKLPPGSNKITDTAKVVAAQWKALPEDKQAPYKKLYEDKAKAYKIEFEKWKKEQPAKDEEADDGEDGDDDEEDEDDDE